MFVYLFGAIVQFVFIIGIIWLGYYVFLSDWIKSKRQQTKDNQAKYTVAEKLAHVKMISNDDKEIERFIAENAQYLSVPVVDKLVNRIEAIKNDQVINADTILKSRFAVLENQEQEEPQVVKHARTKKI